MGTLIHGINGHFIGKVGDLVGSHRLGKNYIKHSPKISLKPKSEKQLAQQAKFTLAIRLMHPVLGLLRIGFREQRYPSQAYQVALKHTLREVIKGDYPNYLIDYSKIQFSRGSLGGAEGLRLLAGKGCLFIIWNGDGFRMNAYGTDRMHLLIYEAETGTYLHGPADIQRMQGAAIMPIPEELSGKKLQVYSFCASDCRKVSDTVYAGEISIQSAAAAC